MIRVLFRAFLLFIAFLFALSLLKFVFIKLFVVGLWVAAIVFAIYLLNALFRKA